MTPGTPFRRLLCALALGSALALALPLALPLAPAFACTCAVAPVSQQYDAAEAVFAGLVIEVSEDAGVQHAVFEVRSVYKGEPSATVPVETAASADTCGIQFIERASYLVFASQTETGYATTLCAGTTDDLTLLDRSGYEGRDVSITEAAGSLHPERAGRLPWLAGAGLGVAMVLGAHVRRFRRLMLH